MGYERIGYFIEEWRELSQGPSQLRIDRRQQKPFIPRFIRGWHDNNTGVLLPSTEELKTALAACVWEHQLNSTKLLIPSP